MEGASSETASNGAAGTAANGVAGPSSTSTSATTAVAVNKEPLYLQYPVGSTWDFTLSTTTTDGGGGGGGGDDNNKVVISGATVYCTDEVSDTIMVQKALTHTTLATEVRMLQSSHIVKATKAAAKTTASGDGGEGEASSLSQPLPKIQVKALEERERRAIRLAEESFRHINQKASPEGQAVFDRLLKACNEVVWKGESIIVLHQIQVDPPYGQDNCRILSAAINGKQVDSSLDRVKKIVLAANNTNNNNSSAAG